MTVSFTICALLAALTCGTSMAQVTNTFGSMYFHEIPTLNSYAAGGLAAGWALFALVLIVSGGLILTETFTRHKEMVQKCSDARDKMHRLGMNVEAIDKEFWDQFKPKKVDANGQVIEENRA